MDQLSDIITNDIHGSMPLIHAALAVQLPDDPEGWSSYVNDVAAEADEHIVAMDRGKGAAEVTCKACQVPKRVPPATEWPRQAIQQNKGPSTGEVCQAQDGSIRIGSSRGTIECGDPTEISQGH